MVFCYRYRFFVIILPFVCVFCCLSGRVICDESDEEISRWFWFFSLVNPYPKMESERPIRTYFDPIMGFLAPEQEPVKTVSDFRDAHLVWAPHIGIGYKVNDYWSITMQGGGEGGTIRTKQSHPSIFIVPLYTDFIIKRTAYYLGAGVHYSPWGSPKHDEYRTWKERLLEAKPYLSLSLTHTYATYDAKVKVKFEPLLKLVDLHLSDDWLTTSVDANVGVEIPIKKRDEIVFAVGYSKFFRLGEDFDSLTFTVEYKRYFRGKKKED